MSDPARRRRFQVAVWVTPRLLADADAFRGFTERRFAESAIHHGGTDPDLTDTCILRERWEYEARGIPWTGNRFYCVLRGFA